MRHNIQFGVEVAMLMAPMPIEMLFLSPLGVILYVLFITLHIPAYDTTHKSPTMSVKES